MAEECQQARNLRLEAGIDLVEEPLLLVLAALRTTRARPIGHPSQPAGHHLSTVFSPYPPVWDPVERDVRGERPNPPVRGDPRRNHEACHFVGASAPLGHRARQPFAEILDLLATEHPAQVVPNDGKTEQVTQLILQLIGTAAAGHFHAWNSPLTEGTLAHGGENHGVDLPCVVS